MDCERPSRNSSGSDSSDPTNSRRPHGAPLPRASDSPPAASNTASSHDDTEADTPSNPGSIASLTAGNPTSNRGSIATSPAPSRPNRGSIRTARRSGFPDGCVRVSQHG